LEEEDSVKKEGGEKRGDRLGSRKTAGGKDEIGEKQKSQTEIKKRENAKDQLEKELFNMGTNNGGV